jgi:hypothetical protein
MSFIVSGSLISYSERHQSKVILLRESPPLVEMCSGARDPERRWDPVIVLASNSILVLRRELMQTGRKIVVLLKSHSIT